MEQEMCTIHGGHLKPPTPGQRSDPNRAGVVLEVWVERNSSSVDGVPGWLGADNLGLLSLEFIQSRFGNAPDCTLPQAPDF